MPMCGLSLFIRVGLWSVLNLWISVFHQTCGYCFFKYFFLPYLFSLLSRTPITCMLDWYYLTSHETFSKSFSPFVLQLGQFLLVLSCSIISSFGVKSIHLKLFSYCNFYFWGFCFSKVICFHTEVAYLFIHWEHIFTAALTSCLLIPISGSPQC